VVRQHQEEDHLHQGQVDNLAEALHLVQVDLDPVVDKVEEHQVVEHQMEHHQMIKILALQLLVVVLKDKLQLNGLFQK